MRRQVHTRYRGRPNRRARKVVNLRISQWKRKHGIPAHASLQLFDLLDAAYGGRFERIRAPGMVRMLVRGMCEASR